jgi:hypothetical protein
MAYYRESDSTSRRGDRDKSSSSAEVRDGALTDGEVSAEESNSGSVCLCLNCEFSNSGSVCLRLICEFSIARLESSNVFKERRHGIPHAVPGATHLVDSVHDGEGERSVS